MFFKIELDKLYEDIEKTNATTRRKIKALNKEVADRRVKAPAQIRERLLGLFTKLEDVLVCLPSSICA